MEGEYAGRVAVLGVHSPKFPNERETPALRAAVERLGVAHPVANDRDFVVWRSYGCRAWPTLVFIDPQGRVIGRHEGEFDYAAMAETLDAMLEEFRAAGLLAPAAGQAAGQAPASGFAPRADHLRYPAKAVAVPGGYAVSDTGHHRVVWLDPSGRVGRAYGGPEAGFADGDALRARFRDPQGLAWFRGELLVADTGNHALRAVDPASGRVRTLAGTGRIGPLWSSPWDLAADAERVYVAMAGNHRLAVWRPERPEGEWLAGSGREGLRDGPAAAAEFAQPSGLCLSDGVLYVADSESSAVRAVDPRTGVTRTLVGQGLFAFGDADGTGPEVRLQHCLGVAARGGALYVADSYNHKVKRLDPATARCATLAGAGRPGLADGRGDDALFSEPGGIAAAGDRLLVADTNNHALRLVDPESGEVRTLPVVWAPRSGAGRV